MADDQSFIAAGARWSQEIALGALGKPSSFQWAQAVLLDCGGDDSQWMAMVRNGLAKGARVGILAASDAGVSYGELIGATQTFSGSPKRNHPKLSLLARAGDVVELRYRPYVRCSHHPYSELTLVTTSRERRFGIDWCADLDAFVDRVRSGLGFPESVPSATGAPWRSDGVYVAARNREDNWKILAYDSAGSRVAYFTWANPGRAWTRASTEADQVSGWMEVRPQGDGTFRYGQNNVHVVPGDGYLHTFYENSSLAKRWNFFDASVLDGIRTHSTAGLSPSPGRATLQGNDLVVVGYEPYRTAADLDAANAARGPVPVADYITSAVNAAIRHGRGFFPSKHFETYLPVVMSQTRARDRIDLCVPVVVEEEPREQPADASGVAKYRPTGKLEAGLATTFDDRVLLTWSHGLVRMEPRSITIRLDEIAAVNAFDLYAKLSKVPALEVLLATGARHVVTFTNHPDCKADLGWWRDVLMKRLRGDLVPVFDGAALLRWQRPDC